MNQADRQRKINEALSYLRLGNRGHCGCIRLNPQSKGPHNDKIIELCKVYLEMGVPFVTEAIFQNNSRCDILLPSIFQIVEVLNTETEERFNSKNYPKVFKITKVRV